MKRQRYAINEVEIKQLLELVEGNDKAEDILFQITHRRPLNNKKKSKKKPIKKGQELTIELLETSALAIRKNLIINQTASEKRFKAMLKMCEINYEFQKIFYTLTDFKKYCVVDFYIPDKNIVIEIDGGVHDTARNKAEDSKRSRLLRRMFKVEIIRVNNYQLSNTEECMRFIETRLE
jgi:very-short-patch-repair endonuclease